MYALPILGTSPSWLSVKHGHQGIHSASRDCEDIEPFVRREPW